MQLDLVFRQGYAKAKNHITFSLVVFFSLPFPLSSTPVPSPPQPTVVGDQKDEAQMGPKTKKTGWTGWTVFRTNEETTGQSPPSAPTSAVLHPGRLSTGGALALWALVLRSSGYLALLPLSSQASDASPPLPPPPGRKTTPTSAGARGRSRAGEREREKRKTDGKVNRDHTRTTKKSYPQVLFVLFLSSFVQVPLKPPRSCPATQLPNCQKSH